MHINVYVEAIKRQLGRHLIYVLAVTIIIIATVSIQSTLLQVSVTSF